jgi:hypothetical protein
MQEKVFEVLVVGNRSRSTFQGLESLRGDSVLATGGAIGQSLFFEVRNPGGEGLCIETGRRGNFLGTARSTTLLHGSENLFLFIR